MRFHSSTCIIRNVITINSQFIFIFKIEIVQINFKFNTFLKVLLKNKTSHLLGEKKILEYLLLIQAFMNSQNAIHSLSPSFIEEKAKLQFKNTNVLSLIPKNLHNKSHNLIVNTHFYTLRLTVYELQQTRLNRTRVLLTHTGQMS